MIRRAMSDWFRGRRDALLRELIAATPRRGEVLRIVDLGGNRRYWERFGIDFLRGIGVRITLVNRTQAELGQGTMAEDIFEEAVGDACAMDCADDAYDLCHSNSVIEHVGDGARMASFAREARRIAPAHYVQTPNRGFPIDPHFPAMPLFHRLPRGARAALLRTLPLAHAGRARNRTQALAMADSVRLIGKAQMRALFPESDIEFEMVGPFAKSLIAVKTAPSTTHQAETGN